MSHHRAKSQFVMTPKNLGLSANGVSLPMRVPAFQDVQIALSSTGNFAGTVKVQGSQSGLNPYDTAPDFSSAASPSNHWTYCSSYDMALVPQASNIVAGATGYVMSGTDANNLMNIYVLSGGFEWVSIQVSNYSAGTLFLVGYGYTAE